MSKVIIEEQTYPKDAIHTSADIPVDQSADGWSVKISCEKWPAKQMGKFRVIADFGGKLGAMTLFEGVIAGGGLDRQGNPAQFCGVSGTWPGESDGKGGRTPIKAQSINVEMEPIEDMTAAVEVAADLKASGAVDVGGVEVPIP